VRRATPRGRAGPSADVSKVSRRGKSDVEAADAAASDDRTERVPLSASPEVRLCVRLLDVERTVDEGHPKVSLGRAPENEIVVDDDRVSRRHAELTHRDGLIHVRDHSTNGSYLSSGGGRITRIHEESVPLTWTARLQLGWTGGPEIDLVLEEKPPGSSHWARLEAHFDAVDSTASIFRLEGEYWTIAHAGRVLRLRDTRGLRFLAHLLQRPDSEVLAIDLVQTTAGEPGGVRSTSTSGGAGALLDARAKADYRRRLADLESEREEAERFADVERASRANDEIEVISQELSRAVGIGGRDRPASDDAERARVLVTVRVREALRRIADGAPELGAHLSAFVKTGRYCCYRPPAGQAIQWAVD
jgi:hypothetical protein